MKEILVILTAYKRNYFKEQIEAIKSQKNVIIKDIVLWQNESHLDLDYLREYGVKIIKSDINFKYHGRFMIPLLYDKVEYTAIFDDDTIPTCGWLENAIRCVDKYNCIAGQNGRTYNWLTKRFVGGGDDGRLNEDTMYDLVGHCWVFKTEMIRTLWAQKQVSYETGEDMQFCLSAKYHLNVDSYCVQQLPHNSGQTKWKYGDDNLASFKAMGENHHLLRSEIFEHWANKIKTKYDTNS